MTTLKQFLKPDWRKIVLTIIITALLTFLGFIYAFTFYAEPDARRYCCKSDELSKSICEDTISRLSKYPEFANKSPEEICTDYQISLQKRDRENMLLMFEIFLVSFVISYLLSCFIVWIYNKFRRGRKK